MGAQRALRYCFQYGVRFRSVLLLCSELTTHSDSLLKKEKMCVYIYIYGGDPNWWAHFGQKSQFSPSFIVKIGQEKPPQICGGFSCFQVFLLSSFCLFCLSFSSLPLLFDILNSKIVPTRWGSLAYIWGRPQLVGTFWSKISIIYIYIYIDIHI